MTWECIRGRLYLCARDSVALAKHLAIRDYLRAHPQAAREYGELKNRLAESFPKRLEQFP